MYAQDIFLDPESASNTSEKLQKQAMKMSDKKQAIRGEVDGEINT